MAALLATGVGLGGADTARASESPTPAGMGTSPGTGPSSTTSPPPSGSTTPSTSTRPSSTSSTTTRPGSTTSRRPSTSTTTPPPVPAPTGGASEQQLTESELSAQIAAADSLRAELAKVNGALADVVGRLDVLSTKANAQLERYSDAQKASVKAQTDARFNQDLSDRLAVEVVAEKQRLRAWAYYAYTEGGGSVAEVMGVIDSMKDSPAEVGNPVGDLAYLTDSRAEMFATITRLSDQQAVATQEAKRAGATARAEADKAAKAKAAAAELVSEQEAELTALRKTHAKDIEKAGPLVQTLAGVLTPQAQKAYAALLTEMHQAGVSPTVVGKPCSDNESTYPNGELPASALCPLWEAPGESLRPKAAAAFNAMSAAYAKDTGSPLCVTDSYRSYAEQVSVKASRGEWAATPGRSDHGLGLAVDLCGGVNSFGTAAHEWMKQNAPRFGWFHPSWAEPTGSLPEPWHWEYAG